MDGYDWAFADLKVSTMSCPARLAPQYGSLEALSASQHSYAQKLSSWARFSLGLREAAPGAAPVIAQDAPSPIVVKKKRSRMMVEQLTESTEFFDLVDEPVVGSFPSSFGVSMVIEFFHHVLEFCNVHLVASLAC